MKFILWFFGLFSPYVNSFERRINKFFQQIKSTDSFAVVNQELLKLMQTDLIVVNVWLEKKFKGYKYLNKSVRRQMYIDAKKIVQVFNDFMGTTPSDVVALKDALSAKGHTMPDYDLEKWLYLFSIMGFLKPGRYYR